MLVEKINSASATRQSTFQVNLVRQEVTKRCQCVAAVYFHRTCWFQVNVNSSIDLHMFGFVKFSVDCITTSVSQIVCWRVERWMFFYCKYFVRETLFMSLLKAKSCLAIRSFSRRITFGFLTILLHCTAAGDRKCGSCFFVILFGTNFVTPFTRELIGLTKWDCWCDDIHDCFECFYLQKLTLFRW